MRAFFRFSSLIIVAKLQVISALDWNWVRMNMRKTRLTQQTWQLRRRKALKEGKIIIILPTYNMWVGVGFHRTYYIWKISRYYGIGRYV